MVTKEEILEKCGRLTKLREESISETKAIGIELYNMKSDLANVKSDLEKSNRDLENYKSMNENKGSMIRTIVQIMVGKSDNASKSKVIADLLHNEIERANEMRKVPRDGNGIRFNYQGEFLTD